MKIDHVHLPVADLARSITFYRDVLGCRPGFQNEAMASFAEGIVLDRGRVTAPGEVTVALDVDDVDAIFDRISAAGADVEEPPTDQSWGVRNMYVRDPDGYVIEFGQPTGP
jgi:catechol 2,3-dioxygenase-like lactoylglutathione lyase family enzyme